MKFIIALCILSSSIVFGEDYDRNYINCYEAPQQTGNLKIVYKFKTQGNNIKLVYPEVLPLTLGQIDPLGACLIHESPDNFVACQGSGQNIRGLVPIEVNQEETVYCERSILEWFRAD